MFSPIVAHLTPDDHDFNKFQFALYMEACKSELFWPSGSREKNSNDPTLFCNYLPFEEDVAFSLYKLKFHLSKDNLYQV
jgi:hypothetical protein